MTDANRDEDPPAVPAPAEPEEPQASVDEQPIAPEPDDEREADPDAA